MRFFRSIKKSSLIYIIGELILLVIGINLAIWFNNWDTSNQIANSKDIAIKKIMGEIKNNHLAVETVLENNSAVRNAYKEFKDYYSENTSMIKANPKVMQRLTHQFPNFFTITDSMLINHDQYLYEGTSQINLEIPNLTIQLTSV